VLPILASVMSIINCEIWRPNIVLLWGEFHIPVENVESSEPSFRREPLVV